MDETGLLVPYYVRGDFTAAYVLAHEFGHAVRARLPGDRQLKAGSLRELQADCLAGTAGFERIRAFGDGFEGGPRLCLQPDWVVEAPG